MSTLFLFVLEMIGTVSFAISGAVTGVKKKMDLFGVLILGLVTAVGGGVIRDLILGLTPPATFRDPVYALVAGATSLIVFIPGVRRIFLDQKHIVELILRIADSIGLGVFTVVGIKIAYGVSAEYNIFLLIFVGTVTGVGGGVLRDMMAGDRPYIFVKHFYACASLAGALICAALWHPVGETFAMLCGIAAVVTLRLLAAHFRWSLPRAN